MWKSLKRVYGCTTKVGLHVLVLTLSAVLEIFKDGEDLFGIDRTV